MFGNKISTFLNVYNQVKEKGYERIFENFVDSCIKDVLSPRRSEILFKRIKGNMTFELISRDFSVCHGTIGNLYHDSLRKFRHYIFEKKFLRNPILYIEEYKNG